MRLFFPLRSPSVDIGLGCMYLCAICVNSVCCNVNRWRLARAAFPYLEVILQMRCWHFNFFSVSFFTVMSLCLLYFWPRLLFPTGSSFLHNTRSSGAGPRVYSYFSSPLSEHLLHPKTLRAHNSKAHTGQRGHRSPPRQRQLVFFFFPWKRVHTARQHFLILQHGEYSRTVSTILSFILFFK